MTEFDIQTKLFDHFKTLNTYSGIEFLTKDTEGNYTNVHFPNVPFTEPEDNRYFRLTFANNEPTPVGIQGDAQNRFNGLLYIDIFAPNDVGEDEVKTKYKWIAGLFRAGTELDFVDINNVYVTTKGNDTDHYRLQVAVEWESDIDKE